MAKIGFLLGAGFSIPSGLPSANGIWSNLVNGEAHGQQLYVHSCGLLSRYCFQDDDDIWKTEINYYISCLKLLGEVSKTNSYEALYEFIYLLDRVVYPSSEINPVYSFLQEQGKQLHNSLISLKSNIENSHFITTQDHDIFYKLLEYIRDLVHISLALQAKSTNPYFTALSKLAGNSDIIIATLNHDILIENWFDANRIHYSDGFCQKNGSTYFSDFWSANSIPLIKLHGSINWYFNYVQRRLDKISGRINDHPDSHDYIWLPSYAIGTDSKYRYYGDIHSVQIIYKFITAFTDLSHLIIIGYSGNDPYINYLLRNAATSNPSMSIACVDPSNQARDTLLSSFGNHKTHALSSHDEFNDFVENIDV